MHLQVASRRRCLLDVYPRILFGCFVEVHSYFEECEVLRVIKKDLEESAPSKTIGATRHSDGVLAWVIEKPPSGPPGYS